MTTTYRDKILAVRKAVNVPVLANGNILNHEDVTRCLDKTEAHGVMSAEGNLYNPALFAPLAAPEAMSAYRSRLPLELLAAFDELDAAYPEEGPSTAHPSLIVMAKRYLAIVRNLKTSTSPSSIKGHIFKLLMPLFTAGHHLDLRPKIGAAGSGRDRTTAERLDDYLAVINELEERLKVRRPVICSLVKLTARTERPADRFEQDTLYSLTSLSSTDHPVTARRICRTRAVSSAEQATRVPLFDRGSASSCVAPLPWARLRTHTATQPSPRWQRRHPAPLPPARRTTTPRSTASNLAASAAAMRAPPAKLTNANGQK